MWKLSISIVALLCFAEGCARYHPDPLQPIKFSDDAIRAAVQITTPVGDYPWNASLIVDVSDGIAPDEAAVLAVLYSPHLNTIRVNRGLATAQLIATQILPNPQISASAAIPVANLSAGSFTALGLGIGYDVTSFFGRRPAIRAARAQQQAVALDVAWQEWQIATAARLSIIELQALTKKLEIIKVAVSALAENLNRVKIALKKQLIHQREFDAALSLYTTARLREVNFRAEISQARLGLAELLGLAPEFKFSIAADPITFNVTPLPAYSSLISDIEDRRLDLRGQRIAYEAQNWRLKSAIRKQFVPITLGFGAARDNSRLYTAAPSLAFSLPLFDRNQGQIANERAVRSQLKLEFAENVYKAKLDVARSLQMLKYTIDALQSSSAALAAATRLRQAMAIAMKKRQTNAFNYYEAWNAEIEQQLQRVDLQKQLATGQVALDVSSGRFSSTANAKLLN